MSNSNSNNRLSYARWQHDAAMQAQEQRRSSTKQSGHGSNRHRSRHSSRHRRPGWNSETEGARCVLCLFPNNGIQPSKKLVN